MTHRFSVRLAVAVLIVSVVGGGCSRPWTEIDPHEEFRCNCGTIAEFVGALPGMQEEFSDVSIYVNAAAEVRIVGDRSASFEEFSRLVDSLATRFPHSEGSRDSVLIEAPNWVLYVSTEGQRPDLIVFADFEAAGLPEFSELDEMDAEERETALEPLQDQVISLLSDLKSVLALATDV
ncbi:MAG: hypothetical protein ABFS21_11880 [Actinomycetota bacterium]